MSDAASAAEAAARASYGRLVAYLAAQWRDIARAEDALGDALVAALETWPRTGVPARPEAWLLTAARRRLIDDARRSTVASAAESDLAMMLEERGDGARGAFPDERLALMFVCANPAIEASARTPLMLQAVLGLGAAPIASAFLVAPATMSQRLVRVKTKIRDAGITFALPEPHELPGRLEAVLEAIYAAYGTGWDDVAGGDPQRRGLAEEAIWLGRVAVDLLPGEPETRGLLALMLHCEARRGARRDGGRYVPLSAQDPRMWSPEMIDEAERLLGDAARARRPGRFQLEAAIQSAHAHRAVTGRTEWEEIVLLYRALLDVAPTIGARVGHTAAVAEARGAEAALTELETLDGDAVAQYQPYWALRAHLMQRLGRAPEASDAYQRAIGLCEDAAAREFLVARLRDEAR